MLFVLSSLLLGVGPEASLSKPGVNRTVSAMTSRSDDLGRNKKEALAAAEAMTRLALYHIGRNEYAKAEPLLTDALETIGRELGRRHASYGHVLNLLGCLSLWAGKHERADALLCQARDVYRETLGESHPSYMEVVNNLAGLYIKAGKFDEAKPLLQRVVDFDKGRYGEGHPRYARSLINLSFYHLMKGEYGSAEQLLRSALAIYRKAGDDHPGVGDCQDKLGQVAAARGDYAAAEGHLYQAISIHEKTLTPGHPHLVRCLTEYATTLRKLGREEEARAAEAKARAASGER